MKKLLALGLGFISCAAMAATNKISMVTYFPVPYVAYSQVNVGNQMDIGLTGSCDMTLGCPESAVTLNAAQVNLLGGRLNLDGGLGIKGDKLTLGSGNSNGKILFQNVRIQEGTTESVNTDNMTVNTELKLFDKTFPSCKDANSESNGQMQWASLKLKGASSNELYLACGGVASSSEPKADCSDKTYKLTHKSECCPETAYTDTACWVYTDPCENYIASTYKWSKQEDRSSVVAWNTGGGRKECRVDSNRVTCPDADSSGVNIPDEKNVAIYFAEKASSLSLCSDRVYEDQPCNNDRSCIKVSGSNNLNTLWASGAGAGSVSWNKYICELESCTQVPVYLPNGWSW